MFATNSKINQVIAFEDYLPYHDGAMFVARLRGICDLRRVRIFMLSLSTYC
jgi:hypothetical protein